MTAKEELVKYIMELTPDKVELLTARLPRLISEFEAHGLPVHQKENTQTE